MHVSCSRQFPLVMKPELEKDSLSNQDKTAAASASATAVVALATSKTAIAAIAAPADRLLAPMSIVTVMATSATAAAAAAAAATARVTCYSHIDSINIQERGRNFAQQGSPPNWPQ